MLRILLHGCCGYMGRVLTEMIAGREDMKIAAGIDMKGEAFADYPVYSATAFCKEEADVLVDFSAAPALDALMDFIEERKIPSVICTTGLSEAQLERLKKISEDVPVFRSSNMSLGLNTVYSALRKLAPVLAEAGFDIEIVEKHHRRKLDAPSGTALSMAELINESLGGEYSIVLNRSDRRAPRDEKEIGIQSVRGGTIVGDHDVYFAGEDELITISHRAYSRSVFATGALQAAAFMAGKPAGLYSFEDMM